MFKELILSIARAFNKHKIPYMIIGGQAVLLYGEPRLTKDIDITVGLNIDSLDKIVTICRKIGLTPIPGDYQHFVKRTMVLPLSNEDKDIRVDIIFSFSLFEREAIKKANPVDIEGTEVFFVTVEDLVVFKIFAGRPRDIEDVRIIMVKNKEIDIGYIKKKLKELSFEYKDFLQIFKEIKS